MEVSNEPIHFKVSVAIFITIVLISAGTIVYHDLEKWSYVDSVYFSVTTLTTVGYGDMHPTNDMSKIFTVIYILFGVSIVFYLFSAIGNYVMQKHSYHLRERIRDYISDRFSKKNPPPKKQISKSKRKV
ncbi:MAG: potassium channel family protein [Candidatus Woesearchaeota archaeon]|jgi:hypothetical protein|nr:potassium channel family protein [Candidatus Woesearchaeota archaeon]